jgi:hypothetical protein
MTDPYEQIAAERLAAIVKIGPGANVEDADYYIEWMHAFSAFQGAFDTIVARRKQDDMYAQDARKRLHEMEAATLRYIRSRIAERLGSINR